MTREDAIATLRVLDDLIANGFFPDSTDVDALSTARGLVEQECLDLEQRTLHREVHEHSNADVLNAMRGQRGAA
jgi:hypothetical protein